VGSVGASEVGLKFLAAPINPSDINLVRHYVYMSKLSQVD
jgi:hypothetical protein